MDYKVEFRLENGPWFEDRWFDTKAEALDRAVSEAKKTTDITHRVVTYSPEVLAEIQPMGGINND